MGGEWFILIFKAYVICASSDQIAHYFVATKKPDNIYRMLSIWIRGRVYNAIHMLLNDYLFMYTVTSMMV